MAEVRLDLMNLTFVGDLICLIVPNILLGCLFRDCFESP